MVTPLLNQDSRTSAIEIPTHACTLPCMEEKTRLALAMEHGGFVGEGADSELARRMGVAPQLVRQARLGRAKTMTAINIFKAAKLCRVSPHWLATGEGSMVPPPSYSVMAMDVAKLFDAIAPEKRERAYSLILQMLQFDRWPRLEEPAPSPAPTPAPAPSPEKPHAKSRSVRRGKPSPGKAGR